jgi:hypothetical protein
VPRKALETHLATRYVQPLREGGSLPAIVDADDGTRWVVKFRGAGQGAKALVAELLVGMLAQLVELPVPELAIITVPPPFGRSEPDPEIQDLLRASHGPNVGMRYLDGAFNFDPTAAGHLIDEQLATRLVWFDALVTNPDRTHRNPNLLIANRQPWLIDHGAALYAHHDWESTDDERARSPFPLIKQHVLLARAGDIAAADSELAPRLTRSAIDEILEQLPDELLAGGENDVSAGAARERARYARYLGVRLESPRKFVKAAEDARDIVRREPPRPMAARR